MLRIKKQLYNRESPPSESALSSLAHGGASRSVRGHARQRYEATRSTAIVDPALVVEVAKLTYLRGKAESEPIDSLARIAFPPSPVYLMARADPFPYAGVPRRASWIWRGILSSRDVIRKALLFIIGNGNSTRVWVDPQVRVPLMLHFKPVARSGESLDPQCLGCDLMIPGEKRWDNN
ncbi:RNA-directed DNA polymerase (reversetranscriptase)-related family protein, partial [Striga asiatica]